MAIVGAGPTGLSAAYYLSQFGHACEIFDENPLPGGRLLHETTESELPRDVLAAEVVAIERLGVVMHAGARIVGVGLTDLRARFDAVLLACGTTAPRAGSGLGTAGLAAGHSGDAAYV